jgi:hypothetical protein
LIDKGVDLIKVANQKNGTWVTFTYKPRGYETKVVLCGEWSEWSDEEMKQKKNGDFYVRKKIKPGVYQFGYRVNEDEWHCDDECEQIASPFGSHNSLLKL